MATLVLATPIYYETDYQFTMYVAFASTETSCTPICYDAIDALVQLNIYWPQTGLPCDYLQPPVSTPAWVALGYTGTPCT